MRLRPSLLALLVLLTADGLARAEAVRFRFAPADANGAVRPVPIGPDGALGERLPGLGAPPRPVAQLFRPNQVVTFRHPYTGCNVAIPLTLPDGTPRVEHRPDRVVFNYGSYVVEARFLTDGSVDVIYNSFFLRPLRVQ